jgi:hypothetical protein
MFLVGSEDRLFSADVIVVSNITLPLAMLIHWVILLHDWPVIPMITWIGPIMLMFAAVLPRAPGKTLVRGLLAASMNPRAMALTKLRGHWDYGPKSRILLMHYPDVVLVGGRSTARRFEPPRMRR